MPNMARKISSHNSVILNNNIRTVADETSDSDFRKMIQLKVMLKTMLMITPTSQVHATAGIEIDPTVPSKVTALPVALFTGQQ